jgi:hypothetical protein
MNQMDDVPPLHPEGTLFQAGEEESRRGQAPISTS